MTETRTMRERMLAGEPYIADDPHLEEASYVARERMAAYNATPDRDKEKRQALLHELLSHVGADTVIRSPLYVDYGSHITIGSGCFANYGLVALDVAPITIGDDVQIGPNVQLLTPTHPIEPAPRRDKWESAEPITIGDTCGWAAAPSSAPASRSARTPWSAPARSSPRTCRRTSSRSATRRG